MLCDICNKRKAKIYYTEIINGEKREQHVCEECAAEFTNFIGKSPLGNMSLGNILSGILGNYAKGVSEKQGTETVCECCGMTMREFLAGGKFGCAGCYKAFRTAYADRLRVIQGADVHLGKCPQSFKPEEENKEPSVKPVSKDLSEAKIQGGAGEFIDRIEKIPMKKAPVKKKAPAGKKVSKESELQTKLSEAIAAEEYEEAARLRDEIRALKKQS